MLNWMHLLHPVWYMEADKGDGSDVKKTDDSQGDKSEKETAIDWTKIDPSLIPEDLIKKNSAYKTVLDESVKRRQEIKKLKDDALKLGSDEEEKPAKKEEIKEDEAPAWAKQIIEEINALKSGSLEAWKQEAADEYGIKSKSVMKTFEGKSKDEVFASAKTIAEELGIPKPAPSPGNPKINVGNPSLQRDKSVLEQAKARMRGTQGISIFDPKVQESLGGGIQIIE